MDDGRKRCSACQRARGEKGSKKFAAEVAMPVYEYACDDCQQVFEVEQRITEDPLTTCVLCEGTKVKRLISQTSFVLKGSGWYVTDYKGKKPEADNNSAKSAPTNCASGGCSSCEHNPAVA